MFLSRQNKPQVQKRLGFTLKLMTFGNNPLSFVPCDGACARCSREVGKPTENPGRPTIFKRLDHWETSRCSPLIVVRPRRPDRHAPTPGNSKPQPASTRPVTSGDDPLAAEEEREARALQRYLALLEKTPRRGTALDRVYGYHVERGSLDLFLKSLRDRTAKAPDDGASWVILGLLEAQRGQDAAAVEALSKAEAARPGDPLPAYYLGQELVLVGQPERAAEAFERAIGRRPQRNDLLEIFQALGRVYQRTQKSDQALQVWNRLEALFPDDLRVQEQIAIKLAEEDQPAQALPRFQALAAKVKDPFRRVQLAMQAAELKVRLGRTDEALHDFESLLGQLRPDSWLHREVRRKIEEVFSRSDDQAGLVAYYERWTRREGTLLFTVGSL